MKQDKSRKVKCKRCEKLEDALKWIAVNAKELLIAKKAEEVL